MTTPTKTVDEIISKTGYDCDGNFLGLSDYGAKQSLRTLFKEAMEDIIGPNPPRNDWWRYTGEALGRVNLRADQYSALEAKLTEMFGEEE